MIAKACMGGSEERKIKGEGRSPQEGAETTYYTGVGIPDAATFTQQSVKHEFLPVARPVVRLSYGMEKFWILTINSGGGGRI